MTELSPSFAVEATRKTGNEIALRHEDIFYSRADKRGVIEEVNDVFQRISGYDVAELIGAPHKIIRHPDMPKGVFHLLWSRLGEGKPVVAYAKNKAKDGRAYWVLGTTWGIDGGYLSARIKPSSDLFQKVPALYAELLAAERDGASPEESHQQLIEMLSEHGFNSYDAFMNAALAKESAARSEAIGMPIDHVQRRFGEMYKTIVSVGQQTDQMTDMIGGIRAVPMNMRILASRLENAGGPISAISANYGSMLDEMATWVHDFIVGEDSAYARIHDAIQKGQFLLCASALQRELSERIASAQTRDGDQPQGWKDREILQREAIDFDTKVATALRTVETEVTRLSRSVLDMKRYVTGLSSARMMCKIESAALHGTGDTSLAGIVDQLDAGQNEIEEQLAGIVQLNAVIQSHTSMVRSMR